MKHMIQLPDHCENCLQTNVTQ